MPPIFTSFDDAWRWFMDGGEPEPIAERRERFTAGRAQFLSFQVPVSDMPVADEVEAVQDELADIDGLDLMPRDLLHASIRGVGFQVIARTRPDDILREDVGRISSRAARAIHDTTPIEATIGPVNVFPDAVVLEVHDGGRLAELRARLDVLERDDAFGFEPAQYLPHVTIATFRDADAAAPLRERLPQLRQRAPAPTTIKRVEPGALVVHRHRRRSRTRARGRAHVRAPRLAGCARRGTRAFPQGNVSRGLGADADGNPGR